MLRKKQRPLDAGEPIAHCQMRAGPKKATIGVAGIEASQVDWAAEAARVAAQRWEDAAGPDGISGLCRGQRLQQQQRRSKQRNDGKSSACSRCCGQRTAQETQRVGTCAATVKMRGALLLVLALVGAAAVGSNASVASDPLPLAASALRGSSDYVEVPFARPPFDELHYTTWSSHYRTTGRPFTAHLAVLSDPSKFTYALAADGCTNHRTTSVSAGEFACEWATNAGFFAFTPPACIGRIIINSTMREDGQTSACVFGVSTVTNKTVIGYMDAADIKAAQPTQLLSGRGWLVRAGAAYVNNSSDLSPSSSFVTEKAPRTAIAVDVAGRILSLVVDGIEATKEGPDLHEMADLLMELGAVHAMNLDGGGSSDAVLKGKVYSRPTCIDKPVPVCERKVTTIVCFRY
eukprot:m.75107 g.75107  ORF g.75107 m.75107 type:complete len:404 (+) comp8070_c0_seq3:1158-2369(+)